MNVHKLPADHIVSQLLTAIKDAADNGEMIESISLTDAEFNQLLTTPAAKNVSSKWYGSNEGGSVLMDIKTRQLNGTNVPVSAYFNGVLIVRG